MKIKINYEFLPSKSAKSGDSLSWWKFQNALLLRHWTAHTLSTFVVLVSLAALERSNKITIEEKLVCSILSCDRRTLQKSLKSLEEARLITRLEREEREEREEIDDLEEFDPETFEEKRKEWQEEGKRRRKGIIA